jgi:hypothetical protein
MMTSSREIEMQASAPGTSGYVAFASFSVSNPPSRFSRRLEPRARDVSNDVSPGTSRHRGS